jgi:hypothetical protein
MNFIQVSLADLQHVLIVDAGHQVRHDLDGGGTEEDGLLGHRGAEDKVQGAARNLEALVQHQARRRVVQVGSATSGGGGGGIHNRRVDRGGCEEGQQRRRLLLQLRN